MQDIQKQADQRNIAIAQVGISQLKYPLQFCDGDGAIQSSVATIALSVALAPEVRGTHMSRFITAINEVQNPQKIADLGFFTRKIASRLDAERAFTEFELPFFIRKKSPISQLQALTDYKLKLHFCADANNLLETKIGLQIPIATLCPCSKAISDFGAHNQRGIICLSFAPAISLEKIVIRDLILALEQCASCELFALLKREDEKYVTEKSFQNPAFVEDVVREVAKFCQQNSQIGEFQIQVTNFESIHNHNAFATTSSQIIVNANYKN